VNKSSKIKILYSSSCGGIEVDAEGAVCVSIKSETKNPTTKVR
jgi:hypothetical protein